MVYPAIGPTLLYPSRIPSCEIPAHFNNEMSSNKEHSGSTKEQAICKTLADC